VARRRPAGVVGVTVPEGQAILIVPAGAGSPTGLVRAWVGAALVGVPLVPRLRAVVVVDELVTNARVHGRLPGVLRLALDHAHRHLQVFVAGGGAEAGRAWTPGAGLSLVAGLTSHWAVDRRPTGTTVWAEVALGARVGGIHVPPQPPPGAWLGLR
jgi:hypothetical protein